MIKIWYLFFSFKVCWYLMYLIKIIFNNVMFNDWKLFLKCLEFLICSSLYSYMDGSDPKWVNSILDIVEVNSLRLEGIRIFYLSSLKIIVVFELYSKSFQPKILNKVFINKDDKVLSFFILSKSYLNEALQGKMS